MPKSSIIIIGAHSDDFAIGAAGTLLKYKDEGKKIISLIASYGENSHPHLQPHHTQKFRKAETTLCSKYLGITHAGFVGVKENNFLKGDNAKALHHSIKDLIKKHRPKKIFTHSIDDPHPDHRALYKITLDVCDELNYKGEVYSYDIWNPLNLLKKEQAKLVVDITPYIWKKMVAIHIFKSQWIALIQLIPATFFRAIKNGVRHRTRFAEIFYRVR